MFSCHNSAACAIADPDSQTVTVTGGFLFNASYFGVPVYGLGGWEEDLENLNVNRRDHACTGFISEGLMVSANKKCTHNYFYQLQVFLVSGGKESDTDVYLDSTELYDPRAGGWKLTEAKLPSKTMGLRASNIDERILFFGKIRNQRTCKNKN